MKIRSVGILVGLAISFAMPALAQVKNAVDPKVRQQIEAAFITYHEAYNKYDAAAVAAFYTLDAIEWLGETGVAVGKQAIEERYAVLFASQPTKQSPKLVHIFAVDDNICAISDFSHHSTRKGDYLTVYVREADGWKIRMAYAF
jgi:ketosteroid isomerase-like protein